MSSFRQFLRAYRLLPEQSVRLDADLFERLEELARARGMSVQELVVQTLRASIQELDVQTDNGQRWGLLTPREQQVAALACLGYTNDEIAGGLVISINTVRSHMRSILDKYGVTSKAELRVILAGWDFSGWAEEAWPPAAPLAPAD